MARKAAARDASQPFRSHACLGRGSALSENLVARLVSGLVEEVEVLRPGAGKLHTAWRYRKRPVDPSGQSV
jgi:hypothetical protein